MHPCGAIWAIGCGQLVNWGVLFFRIQRPARAAARRVRCAALAGRRRVLAGTAGFRDRGARRRAARRSRTGAGCDAGRWPARSRAPDRCGRCVPTIWMTYVVWAALGLCMAAILYEPVFAIVGRAFADPDGAAARDRDRHGDGRPGQHGVSSRHVGAGDRGSDGAEPSSCSAIIIAVTTVIVGQLRVSRSRLVGAHDPRCDSSVPAAVSTTARRCPASDASSSSSRCRSS